MASETPPKPAPLELDVLSAESPTTATMEPRRRLTTTLLYCLIVLVQGCCVNIVGPAGPSISAKLGVSLETMGNVMTSEGAGGIVGAALISFLFQRYDHCGHSIIRRVEPVLVVCLCGMLLCTTISEVVALYFVMGACLGCMSGVANTLVSWVQHGRNVGPWVNLVNASFGIGSSGAPLVFVFVQHHFGDGMGSYALIAVLAAAAAAGSLILPSPRRPPSAEDAPPSPLAMLHGAARGRSTFLGIDLGSRANYVMVTVVVPFMAAIALGIGGEIAFGAWIYSYGVERVHMRNHDAALLNALYWCTFTAGRLLAVPLAAWLTPEMLLLPTVALEAVVALLVLANPASAPLLFSATIGAGIGVCTLYSNTISLLASYDLLNPRSVSLLQLACGVGHMTVPNAVALTMRHSSLGHESLFYVLVVTNTTCLLITAAVVAHLRAHFNPAKGSVRERQLAAKRAL